MASFSILDKYQTQITASKMFFTFGRDPFSYWSIYKISVCASIMTPSDFYKLMVEAKFIDNTNIRCDLCNQPMQLNVNNDEADKVKYDCKKTSIKPGKFFPSCCNTSKTARTNSWFFRSKLALPEILLQTYSWWYKVSLIPKFFKI